MNIRIPDIQLSDISRHRGPLMGAAILFIVLFHVGLSRHDPFFGLRRMGNVGVDMFFLLSGIGLWFSWVKQPSVRHFFVRRYLRIYPAWLLIASLYYIPRFHGGDFHAWLDLVLDITINWGFWLHDELTFWYIPATMMLYLFAPAYMSLIQRYPLYRWLPVAMIVWCVAVQWVLPIHDAVGHIEIFWSRVPIFFIGINLGESIRRQDKLPGSSLWLILLMFALCLSTCLYLEQVRHGKFPLFIERMVYIPLTITSILLLATLFSRLPARGLQALSFLGTLSLEIYLIHSHFVLTHLERLGWSYWPKALCCLAITLPLAWLLGWLTTHIRRLITPCLPSSLR